MIAPLDILKKYWGHTEFRAPQEEIISSVLNRKNTITLLPTGGGKSICFQVPAMLMDGICVVISPTISLIKDQLENLKEKGIKAATIHAGTSKDDIIILFDNLKFGGYKFLYLSPERLSSSFVKEKIKELNVSIVAIDEAHCISEWGHDFRPSYRQISTLQEIHPNASYVGLTATATKDVLADICKNLKIEDAAIFKKSFLRKELAYQVLYVEDKLTRLLQTFKIYKNPSIIYVRSRKRTEEIAAFLNANNFQASYYHGGLTSEEKKSAFNNWMHEKTQIMVATNAFGMGIDKSNVEVVMHLDLPNSIENYVQEAGRAGRNGEQSISIVLQNNNDIHSLKSQFEAGTPTLKEIKEVYKYLLQYYMVAMGELPIDPYPFKLTEFCNRYNLTFIKTNTILKVLANNGIIELHASLGRRSSLQFIISSNQLIHYKSQSASTHKVVDTILRNYVGIYDHDVHINEFSIAKKTGTTSKKIKEVLQKLNADKVAQYVEASDYSQLYFLVPREDDRTINSVSKNIKSYLKQQQQKISNLIDFIKNDRICRSVQLLSYFGEENAKDCGICDVCQQKQNTRIDFRTEVLNLLKKHKELSSIEIQTYLRANEKDILIHLRNLLLEGRIAINGTNKYYIV